MCLTGNLPRGASQRSPHDTFSITFRVEILSSLSSYKSHFLSKVYFLSRHFRFTARFIVCGLVQVVVARGSTLRWCALGIYLGVLWCGILVNRFVSTYMVLRGVSRTCHIDLQLTRHETLYLPLITKQQQEDFPSSTLCSVPSPQSPALDLELHLNVRK